MALYCANDKAIFDALNLPAVNNSHLRELFISRGIIISKDTSRRSLAEYFSRLAHDYRDYSTLAQLFGSPVRRERLSSLQVNANAVDIQKFETSAHVLCESIQAGGDTASVVVKKSGNFDIVVKYQVTQFNQTEFRQVVSKEATISVESLDRGIVISGPHNENVDEWIRTLIADVGKEIDETLDIDEVSLENIISPRSRSEFFMKLINNIEGYSLHDVSDAYVFNPNKTTGEFDLGVHITKASLKGVGVLQSEELSGLFDKGFYLWKIIWQAKQTTFPKSDLFEFEAQFSEPESCTRFSYLPRGLYRYQEDSSFAKSRVGFIHGEDALLGRKIEEAARLVLKNL
jgi:hypothetical protein